MHRPAPLFLLLACLSHAQEPTKPIGAISSGKPFTIDGASMSPTGASSYPVVPRDEIATQAPALFTTSDRNVVTFDADTKAKLNTVEANQTYIFLRQGGLAFDAKYSRLYICAGGSLFVLETLAKGAVRLAPNGTVSQSLTAGVFAEQGKRSCTDAGIGGFLSGVPGAAGAAIAPAPGGGGLSAGTLAKIAIGVGVGAALGISAFTSTSFPPNANPLPPSPSQP